MHIQAFVLWAITIDPPYFESIPLLILCDVDVRMMMVMMSTVLTDTDIETNTTGAIHQSSLLAEFAAGLVSPQVVEAGKAALAAQAVELAQHMLVFRPVGGHVALEV